MSGYIGVQPVPQTTQTRDSFTATANQTSFGTSGYQVGYLDVYLNGVKLAAADYTATNGTDIVLGAGAAVNDILEIVAFGTFSVASQTFTGTTTLANLAVTGNVTSALDLGSNNLTTTGKMLYANVYSATSDLPSASTYHGMFAHVHGTGLAYYAHAGAWVALAKSSELPTNATIKTAVEAASDIALGGNPTTTTQAAGNNTTRVATTAFTQAAITALVDSSPASLNTLNELAAALGNDANFSTTVTNSIAAKLPLAGGAMTGAITTNSTFDGVDIATRDAVLTSTTTTANAALPKAGGAVTGNVTFGDGNKAIFGGGSDLQIYHDGTHSYVDDAGTGRLILRGNDRVMIQKYTGEDMISCLADGAVNIYHNNAKKIETTATGVAITGNTIAKGYFASEATNSTNKWLAYTHTDNTLRFNYNGAGADEIVITSGGNVGIGVSPTHKFHALTTDSKGFLLDRNTANSPANLNEYSSHYSLSIKNRGGGSYLNFGGTVLYSSLQATDGAGSAAAKIISINPHGGNVGIGTNVPAHGIQTGNFRGTGSAPSFSGTSGDGFAFDYYNGGNPYPRHGSIAVIGSGTATADLSFWTDSGSAVQERFNIDAGGKAGFGTSLGNSGGIIGGVHIMDRSFSSWNQTITKVSAALRIETHFQGNNDHERAVGDYGGGIAFNHLGGHSGTHGDNLHAWIGLKVNSTTGNENSSLVFATNSVTDNNSHDAGCTERLRIDPAGNITFPNGNLSGYGQTSGNGGLALRVDSGSAGGSTISVTNAARGWSNFYVNRIWSSGQDARIFQFTVNGVGVAGGINVVGATAINFVTSSDYRLKENVVYDWDATTRLKQLKPARFNFISDGTDLTQDGFLAHEAQEVVPIAVNGTKDAMRDEEYEVSAAVEEVTDDDGNVTTEAAGAVMGTRSVISPQGIDHSKLVPLLVKTIQELEARITALEA